MTGYRGAVLIIGSLWWDNNGREQWRNERLVTTQAIHVFAPIRYGRLSQSRKNTYTMVFSNLCYQEGMGTGLLVPFQNYVLTFEDLKTEAAKLWHAERPASNETEGEISCSWGAVGLMVDPNIEFSAEITAEWRRYYQAQSEKPKIQYARNETPIISDDGILDFVFPLQIDNEQPVKFDFILATATKPKPNTGIYPAAQQIAQACLSNKYTEYFDKNQKHGIHTFQDDQIKNLLHPNE